MTEEALDQPQEQRLPDRPVRLREAREAAGLHIAALAAALKVPVRKLEALEAGRYEELPDLTFARALASSACRQLKVEPGPVLEQIPLKPAPALGDRDTTLNAPFKGANEAPSASVLSWLSRPALLGAIALLLAALVVFLLPSMAPAPEATPPVTEPVAAPTPAPAAQEAAPLFQPGTPATGDAPPAAPAAPAGGDAPADAPSPGTPASPAPTSDSAAATPVAAVKEAPASGGSDPVLRLLAREESWAEVTNGTGTVVLQRLLQPGEQVEFSAAPPYAVLLGQAAGVQVTLRGRAFDAGAIARSNVARFEAR